MLGGSAISRKSKNQTAVALSTAEAEHMVLASATQEAVWLRRLLTEMKCNPLGPSVLHEDNQSAMALAQNTVLHGRSKHIDIHYHFIQEHVCDKTVSLKYCSSSEMIADMLTKKIPKVKFELLHKMACVTSF